MEKLAIELRFCQSRSPIDMISDDWMANECQMDPNLMSAAGLDRYLEQGGVRKSLNDMETRHRWSP